MGLFPGPVAVGRAPVQAAVVGPLALRVGAIVLVDDDVLALAPVEERGQPGVELDGRRRHVELPLDPLGRRPSPGDLDEDDVVRMELETSVGQEPEEQLRLFRARGADKDEAAAVEVGGHAPHGARSPRAARPGGDVHGQADGQAPEGPVPVRVDEDPRLRPLVIEAARLPAGDAVDGVYDAVRLDVAAAGRGREVLDPEVVEVGDVGPELDDGAADPGVPLVTAFVAEVALHLGGEGVAHPGVGHELDGDGLLHPGHGVRQGDALDRLGRLELAQGLDDPVHALLEVGHRGRVGQPDVVVGAEGVPGHDGHPGLLEEIVGQAVGVADLGPVRLLVVEGLDVREEIERAPGLEAGHPRDRGQAHEAVVAAALELGDHLRDVVLGAVVGLEAGLLGDGAGVRGRVALDLGHAVDDVGRSGGEADPPAGHGVGLRHAVDDDRLLLDILAERGEARELEAVEDEAGVDLVGDDVDVLALHDLGQGQELVLTVSAAGRIGRVVEDEGLGRRGDRGLERLGGQEEAVLLAGRDYDGLALGQRDALGVGHPVGRGDDDLLALVDEGLDEVEEGALGPGGDDDLLGRVFDPEVLLEALGDGLAQGEDAVAIGVSCEVVADGLDPGLLDVLGRREIRLADAEVDDVDALGLHGLGLGRDLQGGGGADALDFFRDHGSPASTPGRALTSSRLWPRERAWP